MEVDSEQTRTLALEKIKLGQNLQVKLSKFDLVEGVPKTKRKINQEIKFLQKVLSNGTLKLSHVTCSNLTHYEFLVKVLEQQKDVVEVDAAVNCEERDTPLRVDVICEGGRKWIKVTARNSRSIRDAALGCSGFGARSILDQAEEYVSLAQRNLFMFQPPIVVFQFLNNIDDDLKAGLKEIGVTVAEAISSAEYETNSPEPEVPNINILNIDITVMLAYVSALTNGSNCWRFKEPILNQQSEWEAQSPVKPVLDRLFEGKRLICCKTALSSFEDIVSLLGGPNEKIRAGQLIGRMEIFDDVEDIPDDLMEINVGGKIKSRSLKIFAFGVSMKAVTVTSNEGFIRSAKMKGVNIPVFIVQARALTESKEQTAVRAERKFGPIT